MSEAFVLNENNESSSSKEVKPVRKTQQEYRRVFTLIKIIGKIIIVICAILWIWDVIEYRLTIADKSAIDRLYMTFEGYIREGDFARAFELMSPSYRERKDLRSLTARFRFIQEDEEYRLHPQRALYFRRDKAWLFPKDTSQPDCWHGVSFEFEKIEGKWYLTGHTAIYQD